MILRMRTRPVLLAAALVAAFAAGPGRATADEKKDDKNPLREELLKLNSVTGEEAQKTKLQALAKDKEKAKKLVAEAGKMLKEAKGKDNPFNSNGGQMIARLALFTKQYDVAEPFYEWLLDSATKLKSADKMVTAYKGLIGVYWDTKKYALVSETCQKFLEDDGPKEYEQAKGLIYLQWIRSTAKEGKFDEALRLADALKGRGAGGWLYLQTKGGVLREQGKLKEAIEAFTASVDAIDADKSLDTKDKDELKDEARYMLTGLHVDNRDIDKAAKLLQMLIKRNPEVATYRNDLGFIWCDNDMNFEESEKLIKEAIDLDKKAQEKLKKEGKLDEVKPNAAYLDSLGWVLFKQKKYKEALEPLKQAAADDDDGSHLEIWDHLADCHLALGEKKEAIAAWEKALKYEDISKRDGERRRKVSEKLRAARTMKD